MGFSEQSERVQKLIVFLIFGAVVGTLWGIDKLYESYQLNRYGTKIYAKVIGRDVHGYGSKKVDDINITYIFKNTSYISSLDDSEERYSINDSLVLECSSQSPTIIKIIGIRINGIDQLTLKK